MPWLFWAVCLASLLCHCLLAVICELSANAHRPFALHCSELCSPRSLSPRAWFVLSVQHQGLTEQWGEMWKGSDSGSCFNGQLESLSLPAGAGLAPFGLKCERFITTPLCQLAAGRNFLCKFLHFYPLQDGEDFFLVLDSAGWCVQLLWPWCVW